MQGYTDYMIDFIVPIMKDGGLDEEQIKTIVKLIGSGLRWAKDEMTMSDAREYKRKH
jgi:hypothetical protein